MDLVRVCPQCGHENEGNDRRCASCNVVILSVPYTQRAALNEAGPSDSPEKHQGSPELGTTGMRQITTATGPRFALQFKWSVFEVPLGIGRAVGFSPLAEILDVAPNSASEYGDYLEVSRRHARVWQRNGACFVNDLDSAWGTFVNDKRIGPGTDVALQVGDTLRFGPHLTATLVEV